MSYDANGIRIAKSRKIASNTLNSTYIYDSQGKLRTEIAGNTTRNYIYGQDGIVGYEESGEHFMYRKNFFGDIVAIYQGTTKIAEYSYDAWGNCTIVSDYNGYGARNPFRYRGYYFDTDLNMYYLMTRYYDPNTGRFINADAIEYLDSETINGLNLYAYCNNNPIMNADPTGHAWAEIDDSKPLMTQLPQLILLGLGALWGLWELFCESVTWDVGGGAGVGFDVEVLDMLSVGAIYRQDIFTFEKKAGPINVDNVKLGMKVEKYYGATTPFGFAGKGEEEFYYYFSPEYNYTGRAIESGPNIALSAGAKFYWGIGGSASIGIDIDYLFYGFISGQWYE